MRCCRPKRSLRAQAARLDTGKTRLGQFQPRTTPTRQTAAAGSQGVALESFPHVAGRDRPLTWLAHPLEFAPSQGAVLDFVWPVSLPAAGEAEVIAPISKPPAAESKQRAPCETCKPKS